MNPRITKQMSRWLILPLCTLFLGGGLVWSVEPLAATTASITIDGFEIASFTQVQSVNSQSEVAFGSIDGSPTKGRPLSEVTLGRGIDNNLRLSAWRESVETADATIYKRSASLTIIKDGTPVANYFLEQAWPSKLELTEQTLTEGKVTNKLLIETVTLTCDRIQRKP